MSDEILRTIIQISDLHLGETVAGAATPIQPLLSLSHRFEGWLDHHWLGVRELHRFFSDFKHRDPNALLVVSGDVTANGSIRQFELADSVLSGGSGSPFGFGLGVVNWVAGAVPGNHDHWPGRNVIFGPPTPGLRACFTEDFPIVHRPIALSGGRSLTFIMVNSDADVGWMSRDRFMGRGLFVSQLKRLQAKLTPIKEGEIRVMVIHHAISDDRSSTQTGRESFPRRSRGPRKWLEIDPVSLRALEHLLVEHEIKIVMTGHLHVPRLTAMTAKKDGASFDIFETRCGTTTQQDTYPPALTTKPGKTRELPPNTLILHELILRDGLPVWKASIYRRARGRGFVCDPSPQSTLLPRMLIREFKL